MPGVGVLPGYAVAAQSAGFRPSMMDGASRRVDSPPRRPIEIRQRETAFLLYVPAAINRPDTSMKCQTTGGTKYPRVMAAAAIHDRCHRCVMHPAPDPVDSGTAPARRRKPCSYEDRRPRSGRHRAAPACPPARLPPPVRPAPTGLRRSRLPQPVPPPPPACPACLSLSRLPRPPVPPASAGPACLRLSRLPPPVPSASACPVCLRLSRLCRLAASGATPTRLPTPSVLGSWAASRRR
ncbi:hypothetical protein C8E87_6827 [Paractinoplanes brasiliensis]|uniref:Uncharacterized protein n=1 Tax=Paractinoplanes brasiliensis TaxID=52695 RepID=A0A4R6JAB9_9ACTN|nr:hypothetical protein C8E87_6827 [Actinoplanes brasiliensis]